MSGQGGYKHRLRGQNARVQQRRKKARDNLARVRGIFESKGQTWDPLESPQQLAALNHDARRLVQRGTSEHF